MKPWVQGLVAPDVATIVTICVCDMQHSRKIWQTLKLAISVIIQFSNLNLAKPSLDQRKKKDVTTTTWVLWLILVAWYLKHRGKCLAALARPFLTAYLPSPLVCTPCTSRWDHRGACRAAACLVSDTNFLAEREESQCRVLLGVYRTWCLSWCWCA